MRLTNWIVSTYYSYSLKYRVGQINILLRFHTFFLRGGITRKEWITKWRTPEFDRRITPRRIPGQINGRRARKKKIASRMYYQTRYGKRARARPSVLQKSVSGAGRRISMRNFCLNIRRPVRSPSPRLFLSPFLSLASRTLVFVHARVARFDGLLYAITPPGSQSASLSVYFEKGDPIAPLTCPSYLSGRSLSGNLYRCNIRRISSR